MLARVAERFFKVYREEQLSFLLVLVLFFCIRASNIIVENYAETTFLKRYGVQYLPQVFVVNSVALFVVITIVGVFLDRMARTTLLRWLLVALVGLILLARLLLTLNISLVYPFLYVLVAQSRYMLIVVFWVIGGDLFTYRQTKRLFPPIEAGGALGVVLGSAASGPIGRLFSLDNILVAAAVILLCGAATTYAVERRISMVLAERPSGAKRPMVMTKEGSGLKELIPLFKGSRFLQMLLILVLLPNLLLPIFNYQWSVILDNRFASEDGLLMFYGIFKAVSNGLNLVLLLFIGRAFTHLGIITILFVHPVNYLILFGALVGSFTLPVAIFGRITSTIFRTSCNRPAMYMLFNFMDPAYRGRMVSFLQGAVGRAGTLIGSALLLVGAPFVSPRFFGLVGCLGAAIWLLATQGLAKVYTPTLFEGLTAGHIDLSTLEGIPARDLLDKSTVERLVRGLEEDEATAVLAAELLAETADPEVARRMLALVPTLQEPVQLSVLDAVSRMGPIGLGREMEGLAEGLKPELAARCVDAIGITDPAGSREFLDRCLSQERHPLVQARAAVAVYRAGHEELKDGARERLLALKSQGVAARAAAAEAMGAIGGPQFIEQLLSLLGDADPLLKATAARSLGSLKEVSAGSRLVALLDDPSPEVRRQAALALGDLYAQPE